MKVQPGRTIHDPRAGPQWNLMGTYLKREHLTPLPVNAMTSDGLGSSTRT